MKKRSQSFEDALKILPPDMHSEFEMICEHYRFCSLKVHSHSFVSPKVLAELMLMGWRYTPEDSESLS